MHIVSSIKIAVNKLSKFRSNNSNSSRTVVVAAAAEVATGVRTEIVITCNLKKNSKCNFGKAPCLLFVKEFYRHINSASAEFIIR